MINPGNAIRSRVSVSCVRDGVKTRLRDSYGDVPYKVRPYGSTELHDHLEIMLMCSSPGVMDGDRLELSVHCGRDAEMRLFAQSYNKIHPMEEGASQRMEVVVEPGAIFAYVPYPTIPFKDSIFHSVNELRVADGGHLIWGDVIAGGRIHSGERFAFDRYHTETRVFLGGRLLVADHQHLEPRSQPIEGPLFFGGHTHQATLIVVTPHAEALKAEMDELFTEQLSDIAYGFTLANPRTILLRALGSAGEGMHEWFSNVGRMCWSFIRSRAVPAPPAARTSPTPRAAGTRRRRSSRSSSAARSTRPRGARRGSG